VNAPIYFSMELTNYLNGHKVDVSSWLKVFVNAIKWIEESK